MKEGSVTKTETAGKHAISATIPAASIPAHLMSGTAADNANDKVSTRSVNTRREECQREADIVRRDCVEIVPESACDGVRRVARRHSQSRTASTQWGNVVARRQVGATGFTENVIMMIAECA